ncbi:SUF system NifU family Fe-S cluster assembly protein [Candidatus Shapirobacteria bacterium]|nr:SUF system NifU family Fe-S cluster assembly protein [Candidatus Shapirobacteria bacterium]
MDDLYKEIILDHYQSPNNRGKLVGAVEAGEANMTCGDSLKLYVKLADGIIEDAKFDGGGCAISMAAIDLLLDEVIGKKLTDVQKMSGKQIEEMMGVTLTPSRKKCAYLGLEVLKKIK